MHVMPCPAEGNKAERPPMQVCMVLRHRVVGALNHRPRHSYLTEHVRLSLRRSAAAGYEDSR